eukprot:3195401-Prymnesium_polylepis.2
MLSRASRVFSNPAAVTMKSSRKSLGARADVARRTTGSGSSSCAAFARARAELRAVRGGERRECVLGASERAWHAPRGGVPLRTKASASPFEGRKHRVLPTATHSLCAGSSKDRPANCIPSSIASTERQNRPPRERAMAPSAMISVATSRQLITSSNNSRTSAKTPIVGGDSSGSSLLSARALLLAERADASAALSAAGLLANC